MVSEASTSPVVRRRRVTSTSRRCSSRGPSAASCGPASAARPPRSLPGARRARLTATMEAAQRRPRLDRPSTDDGEASLAGRGVEGLLAAANRVPSATGPRRAPSRRPSPMRALTTSLTGSSSAGMPLSGPRRNRFLRASQICSNRTRWQPCSTSDRQASRADERRGERAAPPQHPRPPPGAGRGNARNSTSLVAAYAKTGAPHANVTRNSGVFAADRNWHRPAVSRSPDGSIASGAGSSGGGERERNPVRGVAGGGGYASGPVRCGPGVRPGTSRCWPGAWTSSIIVDDPTEVGVVAMPRPAR